MKILIVHSRYRSTAPSGENHVVDQEVAALRAVGNDVRLFERRSDDIADWSLPQKALLPLTSVWNPRVGNELRDLLHSDRPDVVHVHNTFPLISPIVLKVCNEARVPVVVTVHNYKMLCASGEFFRQGEICHECATGSQAPALRHGCYRGSRVATVPVVASNLVHRRGWESLVSAYVFISKSQRDLLAGLALPPERVFIKPNFVAEFPPSPRGPAHTALYLGRLDAAKGLPLLMRGWDYFLEARPGTSLRLRIAGGGPLAGTVEQWASTRPSVEILGIVPRTEVARHLQQALVTIVPSQWEETFGLVVVEAMAGSVASIAPRSGSFPELITDGVDGMLFEPGRAEGLAAAIAEADLHSETFLSYGIRARDTYERRFRVHENMRLLTGIYQFAIDTPAGTSVDRSSRGVTSDNP